MLFVYMPSKCSNRKHTALKKSMQLLSESEVGSSGDAESSERDDHYSKVGQHAAYVWNQKLLTDVRIYIGNEYFEAHLHVLSCFSGTFEEKLAYLAEQQQIGNSQHTLYVKLDGIQPSCFRVLLDFMYTGLIKLTCQMTPELIRAAKKLRMNDALERIFQILHYEIRELDKPFFVYVSAKKMGIQKKWLLAYQNILNHFEESVLSPEFLNLDIDEVCEILSGDPIAARSEIIVFMAALRWLKHQSLQRERYAVRVMTCVRFSMMTANELLLCFHPPILQDIVETPEIKGMLFAATCYSLSKTVGKQSTFKHFSSLPRTYTVSLQNTELWA